MLLAILLIAAFLAVFAATYFTLCGGIRKMAADLHRINETQTNAIVRLPTLNRQLESLASEINRTLLKKKEADAQYKRMAERQKRDIANISHDLRTPLTSVIGYIELLEDETLTEDERKKYKEILFSRAKSLQCLIGEFYELSRLESGEYRFDIEPLSIQNILCEILASFYSDFEKLGIEPSVEIDEKAAPADADPNAVRRIFTNLIGNALKHGGENFTVTLRQEKNCIVTSFENDAPQLTDEDAQRLFERFYTADRMRSGNNTGLGLAIVKELAAGMNAQVSASLSNGRLNITAAFCKAGHSHSIKERA